eukprot:gene28293-34160_t
MSKPLFSYRDVDVYQRDALLFRERQWLNDTCINFCFRCIEDKSSSVKLVDPAVVSFLRLQVEEEDEFEDLARGLQLDRHEWLYCPINDNTDFSASSTHWSGLLVHIPTGQALHLDSHAQFNFASAQALKPKLALLLKRPNALDLRQVRCPQQDNGHDCGVFVVIFADCILDLLSSTKPSEDISHWVVRLEEYLQSRFSADLPSQYRKQYGCKVKELMAK